MKILIVSDFDYVREDLLAMDFKINNDGASLELRIHNISRVLKSLKALGIRDILIIDMNSG